MPRCNARRCIFVHNPCFGSPSDIYCRNRLTPKQGQKKIKELGLKDAKELWEIHRKQ